MTPATPADTREVRIYRSTRKVDMYLYVDAAEDLERVPEALLQRFGRPVEAMVLTLSVERRLVRADPVTVLNSIAEAGYYLQMPWSDGSWQTL
jgi:uncharacterized protein